MRVRQAARDIITEPFEQHSSRWLQCCHVSKAARHKFRLPHPSQHLLRISDVCEVVEVDDHMLLLRRCSLLCCRALGRFRRGGREQTVLLSGGWRRLCGESGGCSRQQRLAQAVRCQL